MKLTASVILETTFNLKSTALHLSVGSRPMVRVNTNFFPLEGYDILNIEDVQAFLTQTLTKEQKDIFEVSKEVDFSIALGSKSRFRVNAFYQKGYPSVAIRVIPLIVPKLEDLNLPPLLKNLCELKQGLILVVGPTGHGKSTTMASMLQYIAERRAEHVVTIEDPIEYIIPANKSLVEQREMYLDTHSWANALRSILRQDPNIILVGEMRDQETIESVINIAETGHLVFSTLHTNSAAQSVERIINSFSKEKQGFIRNQLADVLEAIVSLRLLPSQSLGMVPAAEVLLNVYAVKNVIREGKTYQIDNIIATGSEFGMCSMERSLSELVAKNLITFDDAMKYSIRPDELRRLVHKVN